MMKLSATTFLLSTALACTCASAETLNFEPLGSVEWTSTTLDLDGTIIQGFGTRFYIFASDADLNILPGEGGAICSAFRPVPDTLRCAADMQISFKTAVSSLSFQTFGHDAGDSVTISAYAGSSLLDSQAVAADKVVDFSALSGVTRLVFDDQSQGSGYAFGRFSFTASPVPEPSTWLLMMLGVAALGPFARRRQAR